MRYAFLITSNGNYGYVNGVKKSFKTKHDYAKDINQDAAKIPTAILYSDGRVNADMYLNGKHVHVLFKDFDTWQKFADRSVLLKGIFDKDKVFWGLVLIRGRQVLMRFDKGLLQYLAMVKKPFAAADEVTTGEIIPVEPIVDEGGDSDGSD